MAARPFSPVARRALVLSLARIEARQADPSPYTDNDILRITGPRLLTDAALQTVACEVAPEPFGWLNVTAQSEPVRRGGLVVLPRHSFDADPDKPERGDLQKVEHLFAGTCPLCQTSLTRSGSWKENGSY